MSRQGLRGHPLPSMEKGSLFMCKVVAVANRNGGVDKIGAVTRRLHIETPFRQAFFECQTNFHITVYDVGAG